MPANQNINWSKVNIACGLLLIAAGLTGLIIIGTYHLFPFDEQTMVNETMIPNSPPSDSTQVGLTAFFLLCIIVLSTALTCFIASCLPRRAVNNEENRRLLASRLPLTFRRFPTPQTDFFALSVTSEAGARTQDVEPAENNPSIKHSSFGPTPNLNLSSRG